MKKLSRHRYREMVITTLIMLLTITTLYAWYDNSQHKTNTFSVSTTKCMVVLDNSEYQTDNMLSDAQFELYKHEDGSDVRVGDIYKTDKNGEVILFLEEGDYYFKAIRPPYGYNFYEDANVEDNYKFDFSVNCGEQDIVLVPTYSVCKECVLILNNLVENSDGSMLSDAQRLLEFEYRITFEDNQSYTYHLKGSEETGVINGTGSVFLHHQDTIIFDEVPCDSAYKIEAVLKEGYTSDITIVEGILKGKDEVTVVHTYEGATKLGAFTLMKDVVNRDGSTLTDDQLALEFEFAITFEDENTYLASVNGAETFEIKSGDVVKLKHGDKLIVDGMEEGLNYTITEKDYRDLGYSSSHQIINGTISKTHMMLYHVTNTYLNEVDETERGTLTLSKEVFDTELTDSFEFSVIFTGQTEEINYRIDNGDMNVYDANSTITIPANKSVIFYNVSYETQYRIVEKEHEGYRGLVNEVEGYINQKSTNVTFRNIYTQDSNASYIEIHKEVTGEGADLSKLFEFTLTLDGETDTFFLKHGESKVYEVPFGSQYTVAEKDYIKEGYTLTLINGEGAINKEGTTLVIATNTYDKSRVNNVIQGEVIWRVPDGYENVIPDEIEVCLYKDDGVLVECIPTNKDKNWAFEFIVPKFDLDGNEIKYSVGTKERNHFEIEYLDDYDIRLTYRVPAKIQFNVKKTIVSNVTPPEETFIFKIYALQGAPLQDGRNVLITGEGTLLFGEITFNKAGTYTYQIREEIVRTSEYEFDIKPIFAEVTVVERNFALYIEKVIYTKDNRVIDSIEFINKYEGIVVNPPNPTKPTEPVKPTEPNKPQSPELPSTGLELSNVKLYGFMFTLAGVLFILIDVLQRMSSKFRNSDIPSDKST